MNRKFVFWSTFAVGPLILLSYWRGVSAFEDPVVYWGNVSSDMQSFIVPWMFVAAVGYLLMWHRFFFAWSEEDVARLHYPWQEEDGKGIQRLMILYAAFLLTSLVWIDLRCKNVSPVRLRLTGLDKVAGQPHAQTPLGFLYRLDNIQGFF